MSTDAPAPPPSRGITIFALGTVEADPLAPLADHFHPVERVDLLLPSDAHLGEHQSKLRAAVVAATHDWILVLRSRERVSDALAREIAAATGGHPSAWGFRLRVQPIYAGRPLTLGDRRGEIRLFHRRHARFDLRDREREMRVEGAVVRLRQPIERITFASVEEHRVWLARHGVPHSSIRRLLLFLHTAAGTGALWAGRITLRYLWEEAAWDLGRSNAAQNQPGR